MLARLVGELLAEVQEHQAVADAVDLAQVVRGEQDRRAGLLLALEQRQHLAALVRVEALARLVEDAHAHARGERRAEQQLALHSVAVAAHAPLQRQPERSRGRAGLVERLALAAAQEER